MAQPQDSASSKAWENAEKEIQKLFGELSKKYRAALPSAGAILDADVRQRYNFKLQLVRSRDVTSILDTVIETLGRQTAAAYNSAEGMKGARWQWLVTDLKFKANETSGGETTGVGNLEFSVTYRQENNPLKETIPRRN